jgi:hypothetical protein
VFVKVCIDTAILFNLYPFSILQAGGVCGLSPITIKSQEKKMTTQASDRPVSTSAAGAGHAERAQDLERRIRVYEELEASGNWPGALGATDYTAIALLTLGLVITFFVWGY